MTLIVEKKRKCLYFLNRDHFNNLQSVVFRHAICKNNVVYTVPTMQETHTCGVLIIISNEAPPIRYCGASLATRGRKGYRANMDFGGVCYLCQEQFDRTEGMVNAGGQVWHEGCFV